MTLRMSQPMAAALLAAGALAALTGCAEKSQSGDSKSGVIAVEATDDACKLSRTSAKAGPIAFKVSNQGSKITEFYLYGPDRKVVSEVEGIGPGTSRTMSVKVSEPGTYATACKPGMVGDGIRGKFTVTAKQHG
ncbi:cupredoxin domain-containing protein [Streptomyces nigrescens]|uniref:cupredoxin domain-containing protein n=1 Tax=Streptomyces nigrescens TaxID=1920 RepID=UPI0022527DCD|nr:cupredoxin domain-containing protein [Streptomyces libani]MCX5447891.1 cupredoxin domain-containing protein [Streptomyces libani]